MSDLFKAVPVEDDTRIIFEKEMQFGDYPILYQKWCWDGILAESIIFISEAVKDLNDAQLESEIKTSPLVNVDSNITIKRIDGGFTFVNFNFSAE